MLYWTMQRRCDAAAELYIYNTREFTENSFVYRSSLRLTSNHCEQPIKLAEENKRIRKKKKIISVQMTITRVAKKRITPVYIRFF